MTPWHGLIETAWNKRLDIINNDKIDCFRLFHGYDEGYPGVSIEVFNKVVVIDYRVDIRSQLDHIKTTLLTLFPFDFIIAKGHQELLLPLEHRIFMLHGPKLSESDRIYTHENGIKYCTLPFAQHNPGLYLDARLCRDWLRENSKGLKILNLFSFTGSLGLSAVVGAAKHVVHLDKSKLVKQRIKENYELNHFTFDDRSFVSGDIYKHLPRAIKSKQKFDGIILDPPPFVYTSDFSETPQKGQDFPGLMKHCSRLLEDNGWIMCLFHRFDASWDDYEGEVKNASSCPLKVIHRIQSGSDFPETNPEKKLRVSIFQKYESREKSPRNPLCNQCAK